MQKNSALNSRWLADIVLNRRSRAYKDLCTMATENGLQSDGAAANICVELKSVLMDLLSGNFEPVNRKLAEYTSKPPVITVRPVGSPRPVSFSLATTTQKVRVGDHEVIVQTSPPDKADAEEITYRVLLRSLVSGDIQRLAICHHCRNLFYRKSLKGTWCSDRCRWAHFNQLPGREEEAHKRYVKRVRKIHPAAPVARRPRKKA
jgi:hypothetical protein